MGLYLFLTIVSLLDYFVIVCGLDEKRDMVFIGLDVGFNPCFSAH